ANSSFTANKLSIVANNSDSSLLTLTLKDANNNLVSGQVVQFTSTLANVTFSSVTENSNGVYSATLRGTTAGESEVSVTVGGGTFNVDKAKVTLIERDYLIGSATSQTANGAVYNYHYLTVKIKLHSGDGSVRELTSYELTSINSAITDQLVSSNGGVFSSTIDKVSNGYRIGGRFGGTTYLNNSFTCMSVTIKNTIGNDVVIPVAFGGPTPNFGSCNFTLEKVYLN
ncbi:MAG: Ig-like domain-containing protein, partial [Vibrio sp.]